MPDHSVGIIVKTTLDLYRQKVISSVFLFCPAIWDVTILPICEGEKYWDCEINFYRTNPNVEIY
jgi:hypothetical protein